MEGVPRKWTIQIKGRARQFIHCARKLMALPIPLVQQIVQ